MSVIEKSKSTFLLFYFFVFGFHQRNFSTFHVFSFDFLFFRLRKYIFPLMPGSRVRLLRNNGFRRRRWPQTTQEEKTQGLRCAALPCDIAVSRLNSAVFAYLWLRSIAFATSCNGQDRLYTYCVDAHAQIYICAYVCMSIHTHAHAYAQAYTRRKLKKTHASTRMHSKNKQTSTHVREV